MIDTTSNSHAQFGAPLKRPNIRGRGRLLARKGNAAAKENENIQGRGRSLSPVRKDRYVKAETLLDIDRNKIDKALEALRSSPKDDVVTGTELFNNYEYEVRNAIAPPSGTKGVQLNDGTLLPLNHREAKKLRYWNYDYLIERSPSPSQSHPEISSSKINRSLSASNSIESDQQGRSPFSTEKTEAESVNKRSQSKDQPSRSRALSNSSIVGSSAALSEPQFSEGMIRALMEKNKNLKGRLDKWAKSHKRTRKEAEALLEQAKALHENGLRKADGLITKARAIIDKRFSTGPRANQNYIDDEGNRVNATSADPRFKNGEDQGMRVMKGWRMPGSVENLHADIDQTLQELPSGGTKTKLAAIKDEVQGLVTPVSQCPTKTWRVAGIYSGLLVIHLLRDHKILHPFMKI